MGMAFACGLATATSTSMPLSIKLRVTCSSSSPRPDTLPEPGLAINLAETFLRFLDMSVYPFESDEFDRGVHQSRPRYAQRIAGQDIRQVMIAHIQPADADVEHNQPRTGGDYNLPESRP